MRGLLLLFMIPALVLCTPTPDPPTLEQAEADLASLRDDRFALFTECAPVTLAIAWFGPVLDMEVGDTEHRTMAEARLRAAGIWHDTDVHALKPLELGTTANGSMAWFVKEVRDPISGETQIMRTWELHSWELEPPRLPVSPLDIIDDPSLRTDARDLMSALTDRFISEYLRVNDPAC